MKVDVIDSIEKLSLFKPKWESILKEMNSDNVFLEPDWIMLWWKHFSDRNKLFLLLVINDQEVIGFCPLMIINKGIYKEIDFIGSRESGRMDFILRNEYRQEALECICNFLKNLNGNNIIKFHGISEKSLNYNFIKESLKVNKVLRVTSCKSFYFLNTKDKDFNSCFKNRFGKKTRQTMCNKEKKLKGLGNLVYEKISPTEIDEAFEIHDKRWLRKIGNSSFSKGETKEFYTELASSRDLQFKIAVDAIILNNKIISFMYGLEYNKKYYFIRIAHDDDFYFLSPGELIFRKKIEECFFSQMGFIDFGPGYEPYKARWTDDYEKVFTIVLPSDNLQSKFIFFINYMIINKIINVLKKNKVIYNVRKYYLGKVKFVLSRPFITNKVLGIKRNISRYGLIGYIIKNFDDLMSKKIYYKQYHILEKDLEHMEISQSSMLVKEATINDLDALVYVMNESSSRIIRRFANKHKCYVTLYENEIIHYCWINCTDIEISNKDLNITLGNFEVHIYDTFIEKKYKNEYIYTYILSSFFNLLHMENYRRCYITVKNCNKSFEDEIYRRIFHLRYKAFEERIFNKIKCNIVDLNIDKEVIAGNC